MKRPYLVLTGLAVFLFFYLILTEVANRYLATWNLYLGLAQKKSMVMTPAELDREKGQLAAERDSLLSRILALQQSYQENEVGVVECVTDKSKLSRIILRSFSPGKTRSLGQFREFMFHLSVQGRFDRIGLFINALESSTIRFNLTKARLDSNPIGQSHLSVEIDAKAFLYDGFR